MSEETKSQRTSDLFSININHAARYIADTSIQWVQSINNAQTVTAQLNNIISNQLMKMYKSENSALNTLIKDLKEQHSPGTTKKWSGKTEISSGIQALSMTMQVVQKGWDNKINGVQTTAQQQTSQMSAQGNDANQATTSAGLMAQLMQLLTSLLQSAL